MNLPRCRGVFLHVHFTFHLMSILVIPAEQSAAWEALPIAERHRFYNIAAKADEGTSQEWFEHLVPEQLQDSAEEVRAFMDGDPELGVPDRDASHIIAESNGGEFTLENIIMEDKSGNRSRRGNDMTSQEVESIEATNAADAELIDGAYESSTFGLEDVAGVALDCFTGGYVGHKAGQFIAKHVPEEHKFNAHVGVGALVAVTTIATGTAPIVAGGIFACKIGKFLYKKVDQWYTAEA